MNDYKPQPLPFQEPQKEELKLPWPKIILLLIISTIIGGGLAFAVVASGMSPQFLNDQDCNLQVENATNQSLAQGYLTGVYDTSQLVLNEGILPVFMEDGSLQYLNLTKSQEEK